MRRTQAEEDALDREIQELASEGMGHNGIARTLRIGTARVARAIGKPKDYVQPISGGSKEAMLQGVPQIPDKVAELLSKGYEPTTPEAKRGLAAIIERACAEIKARRPIAEPSHELRYYEPVEVVIGRRGGIKSGE